MAREIKKVVEKWFRELSQKAEEQESKDLGIKRSGIISNIDINELIRRIEEWLDNN